MAVFDCYFDESYGSKTNYLTIAGYAFTKSRFQRFDKAWKFMLKKRDLPYFHMVDCAHGNGVFAGMSKIDRDATAREAFAIIRAEASKGFALTVNTKDFERLVRPNEFINSAYDLLVLISVLNVGNWIIESNQPGSASFIFEDGHSRAGCAGAMMSKILYHPEIMDICRYKSQRYVKKTDSTPLQAADILAWQIYTQCRHEFEGKPPRKDFKALVEGVPVASIFADEYYLKETVRQLNQLENGLLQLA